MIIPFSYSCDEGKKWVLIELQGIVESKEGKGVAGQELGELTFQDGAPHLTIGRHKLKGKTIKLGKPLMLTQRVGSVDTKSMETKENVEDGEAKDHESCIKYDIVAVIREKYLFDSRPHPLISTSLIE